MNKILKIFTILLLVGFVSSCAKDEVEEPCDSSSMKAIKSFDDQQDFERIDVAEPDDSNSSVPVFINDDGDDEDEDRTLISTD